MATTKITDLTAYTDPVNTDVLPIVDVTSDVTKKVSIANVMKNASLGTNSLPGISFDGDPNTGIYSPGADQVAVTTGGTQRLLIDSAGAVTIAGDLTVNGTTTNINTQNLVVEDKNIVLGDVTTPTDVTADGGGITLKGTTDKTINWVDSTDAWTSSERFSYPTGSAAAPTLTFTGDPNTGIYSPGADQVAISTNGTGRLFVDASGNVGVNKSPGVTIDSQSTGSNCTLALNRTDAATAGQLQVTAGTNANSILSVGTKDLFFSTNTLERLRITSAGLVGVGTSAPDSTLNVRAGANNTAAEEIASFSRPDAAVRAAISKGLISGTTNGVAFGTTTNHPFALNTNGSERIYITNAGLVGIGTSGPSFPLHVVTSGNNGLAVYAGTSSANQIYLGNTAGESVVGTLSNQNFGIIANGGQKVTVTTGGNVGIGTTSPSDLLHISSSTSDANLQIQSTFAGGDARINLYANSGGTSQIRFGDESSSNVGLLTYDHTDDSMAFRANNNERARIDSSGRLLVGTSSARANFNNSTGSAALQVEGTGGDSSAASLVRNSNNADPSAIRLAKSRGTANGSNTVVTSGDVLGSVQFQGADGTEFVQAAIITGEVDGTPGANDMPGRLVFAVTADGASSPTEALRISNNRAITVSDGGHIVLGTTTGTKIGTATTQKLGFYNATPVVQPAAVADATDAATVITQLNDLLAKLRTLGIIAT